MSGLDERLRRVLKGATACEITEPGKELRRKILEQRVAHYARHLPGFAVAPDALDMIADRLAVSGRELDGAVGQLVVETQVNGGLDVTVDVAETALRGKLANLAAEKRVTIQLVQKVVAAHYGMSVEELLSRTRQQNIARPRQIAMFLALKLAKRSLPFTGDKFGGFDHTTVMFARNKIARLAEEDAAFKAELEEITRKIRRENQE
jgi:chromosomal replication initiator protein